MPQGAETSDTRRWVFGLLVIAALAAFGLNAFRGSLATYTHDFATVRTRPGQLLQVPGVPLKSGQVYDPVNGRFEFTMQGVEDHTQELRVRTRQVKPSNFDEASQVVCVGTWSQDDVFEARQLLVKCPSKEVEKMRTKDGGSNRTGR